MERFEHGGYFKGDILDFSVNINPLGMPESVKKILIENTDKFSYYPDPYCTALRKKLSVYENFPYENIICSNGAADIIYRLVYTLKPKRAILIAPTFSEYEKALTQIGCEICFYTLSEKNGFEIDEDILTFIDNADIMFLCNPNNPTGKLTERKLLNRIYERCLSKNIFLAVDECFLGFCENAADYAFYPKENSAVIKAFTKLYSMAGLRLGYILCGNKSQADKISAIGQCWSVSVPALLAGEAALSEKEYVNQTAELIKKERDYLMTELDNLGIKTYCSQTNFIMLYCEIPLQDILIKKGIYIRSCDNYRGLSENYYRIAVKKHSDNIRLIEALKEIE